MAVYEILEEYVHAKRGEIATSAIKSTVTGVITQEPASIFSPYFPTSVAFYRCSCFLYQQNVDRSPVRA